MPEKIEPINSGSLDGPSASTTIAVPGDRSISQVQSVEYEMELAKFLGFGEELDVKNRHVKGLAECLRRVASQEGKTEELSKIGRASAAGDR